MDEYVKNKSLTMDTLYLGLDANASLIEVDLFSEGYKGVACQPFAVTGEQGTQVYYIWRFDCFFFSKNPIAD